MDASKYLTESRLRGILQELKSDVEFIFNKPVPNTPLSRARPDIRCEEYNVIIEFNGPRHYTEAPRILADYAKIEAYVKMNYRCINIPYFVQMCPELLEMIFLDDIPFVQEFPHGFISQKIVLPGSFCTLGIHRFMTDLDLFHFAKDDIMSSLQNRPEHDLEKYWQSVNYKK